jgi:methyl-accepting chemotaxis protein
MSMGVVRVAGVNSIPVLGDTMSGDIERILGRLEASQEVVAGMVRDLSTKLDRIADDAHSTRARVEALEKRITEIEPTVTEMSRWKERFIGARMAVALAWVTLGGVVTTGLVWVWQHLPFGRP